MGKEREQLLKERHQQNNKPSNVEGTWGESINNQHEQECNAALMAVLKDTSSLSKLCKKCNQAHS